jgi:hypothetical protein
VERSGRASATNPGPALGASWDAAVGIRHGPPISNHRTLHCHTECHEWATGYFKLGTAGAPSAQVVSGISALRPGRLSLIDTFKNPVRSAPRVTLAKWGIDIEQPDAVNRELSIESRFASNDQPPNVIIRPVARSLSSRPIDKTAVPTDYFKTSLANLVFCY